MKKIALGTTSQNKQRILAEYLKTIGNSEYAIIPRNVSSGIAEQPLDEETAITGAINRAHNALEVEPASDYGIGLEAGLVEIGNLGYFLVCVCALLEKDGTVHLGISGKTPLPPEVSKIVKAGGLFGKLIREYRDACNDDIKKEWADRLMSREQEFSDAIDRAFFLLT
jgi:non-canonical (house-cleaning) NTP pyrophosphatase